MSGDVEAEVQYLGWAPAKPTFHAQDHRNDNWRPDTHVMKFHDARGGANPPTLEREGLALAAHKTKVRDFRDPKVSGPIYRREIEELVQGMTGASRVIAYSSGNMRFSPLSPFYKTGQNTQPAHFPHVDCTRNTAAGLVERPIFGVKKETLKPGQRLVGYNIWRVVSEPPHDQPLALCDGRSVGPEDLVAADGVYDYGDKPWMTSEAFLVKHNPHHRWIYFSDMRPDEALVFRTFESSDGAPGIPHVAFKDPNCPQNAVGRVSVEAHVYAIFDE
jgi:hypothetical protein